VVALSPSLSPIAERLLGPGWADRRDPDFWFAVILLAGLLIRLYVLTRPLDWIISGFVSDDFFYYAGTAWNIAEGFGSSVDSGLTRHNGYHPLFLLMLLVPAALGVGKVGLIYAGCVILTLATLVSMVLAYRIGGRLGDRRLALCAPIALALSSHYVKMSFHGFETALVVMLTLATVLACLSGRSAWVVGISLGFVALARIDAGFLALPVAAFFVVERRWRGLMTVAGVSFLIVAPWIFWSWSNFGSPVPLSGAIKSAGLSPSLLGPGAANFARAFLFQTFGEGLSGTASWLVTFLLGLGMLTWLGIRRRRLDWIVGYVLVAVILYSVFRTPHLVKQN